MSDEQRDERDELEAEAPSDTDRGDADPEPDFELHGQFFHSPGE